MSPSNEVVALRDAAVLVGDLCRGDAFRLLGAAGRPDLIYVDPPWSASVLATFQRRANAERRTLADVLDALARLLCGFPAFVEIGRAVSAPLIAKLEGLSLEVVGPFDVTYERGKRPAHLLASWPASARALDDVAPRLAGLDSRALPEAALRACPWAARVCDPCTGLGTTWRAAVRTGRYFLGMELDRVRLERAARSVGLTLEKL